MTRKKEGKTKIVEGRNLKSSEIRNSMVVRTEDRVYYLPYKTIIGILKNYVFELKDNYLADPEPYYTEGFTID